MKALDPGTADGAVQRFRLGQGLVRQKRLAPVVVLLVTLVLGFVVVDAVRPLVQWLSRDDLAALLKPAELLVPMFLQLGLVLFLVALLRSTRKAFIEVGAGQLRALVPRLAGLGQRGLSTGEWSLALDQITSIRLTGVGWGRQPATALGRCRLELRTPDRALLLAPYLWVDSAGPDHRLGPWQLLSPRAVELEPILRRTPLVRALQAQGLAVEFEPGNPRAIGDYDLFHHPGLRGQLAALLGFGIYWLIDGALLHYRYLVAGGWAWIPMLLAALGSAYLAWRTGRGAPALERAAVAVLLVSAVAGAIHTASIRLMALDLEPRVVTYTADLPGRFQAPEPGLPAIELADQGLDEFWAARAPDGRYDFRVLGGAHGLVLVDLEPLYERTRAFYAGRP